MTIHIHGAQLVYHGDKAEIEALNNVPRHTVAFTEDTGEQGWFDGAAWHWFGNPVSWGDIVGKPTFGTELFFHEESGSVGGYRSMEFTPADDAENGDTAVVTNGTSPVLVRAFILDQDLGTTSIPSGDYLCDIWAKVSSALGDSRIEVRFYARDSEGVETLLFTHTTPQLTANTVEYQVETIRPNIAVNPTDRLVVKIYATSTSITNRTVTFYYEGAEHYSHIHIPWSL